MQTELGHGTNQYPGEPYAYCLRLPRSLEDNEPLVRQMSRILSVPTPLSPQRRREEADADGGTSENVEQLS